MDNYEPSIIGRLSNNIRDDIDSIDNIDIKTNLDLHLVRLMILHSKKLVLPYKMEEISSLDTATKEALLKNINQSLGIG